MRARLRVVEKRSVVLVGVGTAVGSAETPVADRADAVALMLQAVQAAALDSGGDAMRIERSIERIAVMQGTWRCRDAGRLIAEAIGASARTVLVQLGVPQQQPISDAIEAIGAGEIDIAVVVGGEAKGRDDRARRLGVELPPGSSLGLEPDREPDEIVVPESEIVAPPEIAARFVVPVEQYAAIDNALRYADGLDMDEHQSEIDSLWSRFDTVALGNPDAVFAGGRSSATLRSTADGNRPLAFPYNRSHATQWGVDQAAALILMSTEAADRLGVPPEQRLSPAVSLTSNHSLSLSRRRDLSRWPAMRVLADAASAHLGRPVARLELAELYSCFPAAVRVQQRELDMPHGGTPTVTGGMPFAGGPFNNFVLQSTVAMARRLRERPGASGLVTTVSGLLTKPGLAVWTTTPCAPLVADLAAEAERATSEVSLAPDGERREGTVATYTVRYDEHGPATVVVVADTSDGRVVGVLDDRDIAVEATQRELIGATVVL